MIWKTTLLLLFGSVAGPWLINTAITYPYPPAFTIQMLPTAYHSTPSNWSVESNLPADTIPSLNIPPRATGAETGSLWPGNIKPVSRKPSAGHRCSRPGNLPRSSACKIPRGA